MIYFIYTTEENTHGPYKSFPTFNNESTSTHSSPLPKPCLQRNTEGGRRRKKNKHSLLTRWLFEKRICRNASECNCHILKALDADTVMWQKHGDFSPGDFSYLVCHSLRIKYLDDMRTFLLPDMFIQAGFSAITHSHLSLLEVSSND